MSTDACVIANASSAALPEHPPGFALVKVEGFLRAAPHLGSFLDDELACRLRRLQSTILVHSAAPEELQVQGSVLIPRPKDNT